MRAGLSGCVASARFIRRARHGYGQPPQRAAKREGKRRRQYEKNSILHLPGVRQHFDRDGRRGNRLLRQKAWRHEGAGMRRNARASCRGDGRRMVCDAESPDDKSAFHPLYRVRRHGTHAARAAVSRTECRGAHAENAACDVVYRMQRRRPVHMQAEIKKNWKKTETNAALGSSYRQKEARRFCAQKEGKA